MARQALWLILVTIMTLAGCIGAPESEVTGEATSAITYLSDGESVQDLSGARFSASYFAIEVPSGATRLDFTMWGGTGDADLYIKRGEIPSSSVFDLRSNRTGNDESCSVSAPLAGTYYVMISGYAAFSGATLQIQYLDPATQLVSGTPITGLSAGPGESLYFDLDVPFDLAALNLQLSGGTGDADLYVALNQDPSPTTYLFRSINNGNSELISQSGVNKGRYRIVVYGKTAFAGVTLTAQYSANQLQNGVPATSLSAASSQSPLYFQVEVPIAAVGLRLSTSGGTGDADLYVRFGALPSTFSYDYSSWSTGNNEAVNIMWPRAGTYYVMLAPYAAFTGVTLTAQYTATTPLQNNVTITGLSGAAGSWQYFTLNLPANATNLRFTTTGVAGFSGDGDLYVKRLSPPTTSSYDYRSASGGPGETVSYPNPRAEGMYVVGVYGYTAYAGVSLVASYQLAR